MRFSHTGIHARIPRKYALLEGMSRSISVPYD